MSVAISYYSDNIVLVHSSIFCVFSLISFSLASATSLDCSAFDFDVSNSSFNFPIREIRSFSGSISNAEHMLVTSVSC